MTSSQNTTKNNFHPIYKRYEKKSVWHHLFDRIIIEAMKRVLVLLLFTTYQSQFFDTCNKTKVSSLFEFVQREQKPSNQFCCEAKSFVLRFFSVRVKCNQSVRECFFLINNLPTENGIWEICMPNHIILLYTRCQSIPFFARSIELSSIRAYIIRVLIGFSSLKRIINRIIKVDEYYD